MHLTARGYHRVLRVARTIADLDGVPQLRRAHIAEALSFRRTAPERRRVPFASSRPGPVSAGTDSHGRMDPEKDLLTTLD